MFERAAVDNASQLTKSAVPADITLRDNRVLRGKFYIRSDRAIIDVLNSAGQFLDFEQYSGERQLVSKSAIVAVNLVNAPAPRNLPNVSNTSNAFDPYKILGLKRGASTEDVRAAYHELTKMYHPDRYANIDLPREVLDYINAMSRRINAAFAALKDEPEQTRPRPAAQNAPAEPVFTSHPRF